MSGRPEGSDGVEWDVYGVSGEERGFEPYRPGKRSTEDGGETVAETHSFEPRPTGEGRDMAKFSTGDRVKSVRGLGGGLIVDTVPTGMRGRVVSTRHGLLTEYATVEFDNGYTEEVKTSDVEKERSWF